MERDGLVNEFIGALGNSRSGIHLELMADNGHRFAIFRPNGAAHRVIDVDERVDVTAQFVDDNGQIDLLSRAGLDPRSARRTMRFTAQDLAEATERDQLIQQLARVDQDQLWVAAEALRTAQRRLEEEADAVGSSVEDAAVIERIEQRHDAFERSQTQSEQVRKVTFMVAGLAALLSLPMVRFVGTVGVVPLAVIALARGRGVDRLLAPHGVRPGRRGRRTGRCRRAVLPGLPPAAGQQPAVLRQRPTPPDHRRRGAPRRSAALVGAGRRRRRRVGEPQPLLHLRGGPPAPERRAPGRPPASTSTTSTTPRRSPTPSSAASPTCATWAAPPRASPHCSTSRSRTSTPGCCRRCSRSWCAAPSTSRSCC